MAVENDKAILAAIEFEAEEADLNDLEQSLQSQLEEELEDLDLLQEEREHISNPDHLGETVMNVVWEQFLSQVAATAGEDFIKENAGLTLDLRSEAHIQTTENFAAGRIATHNTEIDYALSEEVSQILHKFLCEQATIKRENFANGRLVRNLYDDLIMNHARRIFAVDASTLDRQMLSLITVDDFKFH